MVEILIVIAIIALLAALLFPALNRAKKYSRIVPCIANLRQLSVAWHEYLNDNDGQMPADIANMVAVNPTVKKVLVCPEDTTKYGNEPEFHSLGFKESYYYIPNYPGFRTAMGAVDPDYGIFVCYVHGKRVNHGSPDPEPSLDWIGLVLRLRRDGSVQHAHVGMYCSQEPGGTTNVAGRQEWASFTDAAPCQGEMCLGFPYSCNLYAP